jgi:hypothetical protein
MCFGRRKRDRPLRATAVIGSADGKRPEGDGWSPENRAKAAKELRKALEDLKAKKLPDDGPKQ